MHCAISLKSLRLFANLLAVVLVSTFSLTVVAADPKHKADYERVLASVKALGDALARDASAGSADVKASLAKVGARQKEAEELATVGEYEAARMILDEGYRMLTRTLAAVKSGSGYSGPSGSAAQTAEAETASRRAAYERMAASARALLDAARRASAESGGSRANEVGAIEAVLRKGETAAASGDFVGGEAAAGEAMKQLRPLLGSMKGGSSSSTGTTATQGAGASGAALAAFDTRLATTKALVDALKRQNREKAGGRDNEIAGIESSLLRAEATRGGDLPGAQAMLDQAYRATQANLQALQTPSAIRTGSAALEAGPGPSSGGADAQRGELDRLLRSSGLLRDAVARKSAEKGADSSAALSRIDALLNEARNRQAADLPRALQAASEANQLAKDSMAAIR